MEPLRRAAEVQFLSHGDEVSKVPEFHFIIHTFQIIIEPNKILDIMKGRAHTVVERLSMPGDTATLVADEKTVSSPLAIEIRPLLPGDDATAFRTLNEEWINRHFTLESRDRETLGDPENTILLKGGHVFMVYAGVEPVGCVALIPMSDGVYELSKMAVSPHMRGRGIGRRLLQHTIGQARLMGGRSLFLGSSAKLANAVHLYESMGFRHVQPETLPPMPYARANVFMEMAL